ncbi:hypothetical protein [Flavihumibacter solisilvae]|uniref:Uncharacterized protein n=1 Tax=Flavihumibacter solisilvae TaxID=1349421 RepID=A0A0C1INZ6_9BACT|nr:hypothetical protein [Flavihumibacter solisilvae]KIC95940.1 hypothetical protein OI18_03405 [Flavihumibacter solisilvae]
MLFRKTKSKTHYKSLSIYVSAKHGHIIFAPVSINLAGIRYEQEACFSYELPLSDLPLGEYTLKYFGLFKTMDKDLRQHKLTDWPAFKHSKAKSVRSFEADYIRISVTGVDENNHSFRIEGSPFKDSELSVTSIISAHTEPINLGDRVNKVINVCLTGKF